MGRSNLLQPTEFKRSGGNREKSLDKVPVISYPKVHILLGALERIVHAKESLNQ